MSDEYIDADLLPLNRSVGAPEPMGYEQRDRHPQAGTASHLWGRSVTAHLTPEQEERDAIMASARVLTNGIAGHQLLAEEVAAALGVTLATLLGWSVSGIPTADLRGRTFNLIEDLEIAGQAGAPDTQRELYLLRHGVTADGQ